MIERYPGTYHKHLFALICLFAGLATFSWAQPTYVMQNATVDDCEGILTDSEDGPEEGQYNHNEDYTFTICQDNVDEILITFDFFATEATYDVLTIYDGPDTNSPVIAALDGVIQPPPIFVATSGCVTFHFVSDDNIVAIGWSLTWSVEIEEPEIPELLVDVPIDCPSLSGIFTFDIPIDCDNFDVSNFDIIGPGSNNIVAVNPLDCDPNTNLAQQFEIIFADSLSNPGTYRILFEGSIQDVCGEWHDVSANTVFDLTNCPFDVFIELDEVACAGSCGSVIATVVGGSSLTYDYAWSHTPVMNDLVPVCTEDSVLVTVTVTDPSTGQSASASYMYVALENPQFINPLGADTVCSSRSDHFYDMTIGGGEFYSRIIPDWHRTTGRYQFWRWRNRDDLERDIITYIAPNGCEAYDTVYVYPVNAGSIQAACEGSAAFQMNGGSPDGGVWSGPHVTPDGTFDPTTSGSFVVTYEALNGCRMNKRVNVEPGIIMPDVDTVCSTQEIDLRADPYGGRWDGPGITNTTLGRLQAWRVTPNQTYTYIYNMSGCSDTMEIYVQQLYAGPDRELCDEESILTLQETGTWTGPGTYIPGANVFDITGLGPGEYDYRLEKDGCSDVFTVTIIEPMVEVDEVLEFCLEDEWYDLMEYVSIHPDYGVFNTPGVIDTADTWMFNPIQLGPGSQLVVFEALGCDDSIYINIEFPADIQDYAFCEFEEATFLEAMPTGGVWSGQGFLDVYAGLFDPQLLDVGSYPITYTAPSGCITEDTVDIFQFEEVSIEDVVQQYCFSDTVINVNIQPPGGDFFINGNPATGSFNPSQLGSGTHELLYTRGSGACESTDRVFFSVLEPISGFINAAPDSICPEGNAVIEITPSGGTGNLSATWDNGLGFGNSHIVYPDGSTVYTVVVEDGCSDPYTAAIPVHVFSPFVIQTVEGAEVCFDDTTFVQIVPPSAGNYDIAWQTNPVVTSDILYGQPGFYSVEITERSSGCVQEYDVVLPGAEPLQANFSLIPNQPCIDIIENNLNLIDLSVGYTDGTVDFGDGSTPISLLSGSLSHEYTQAGEYEVIMTVENDLGCTDTLSRTICVENNIAIYIPNVFSPNGDTYNDEFKIFGLGAEDVHWQIFDRYGAMIFEAFSFDAGWDGTHKGKLLNSGAFACRLDYLNTVSGVRETQWASVTLIR